MHACEIFWHAFLKLGRLFSSILIFSFVQDYFGRAYNELVAAQSYNISVLF